MRHLLILLPLLFLGCENAHKPTLDGQICKTQDGRVIKIEWFLGDRYRIHPLSIEEAEYISTLKDK